MILWYDASYDKSSIHQLFLLEILGGILASVLYNKVSQKLSLRKILVISMILLVDSFLLQWVFSSFCFWGTFLTSFLLNFIEISIKNLSDNLELSNKQVLFSDFIWNLSKMIGTASIKFGETMLPIAIALTNSASFPLILLDFKKNKNYSSVTILELFKKNERVVIGVIICNVIEFLINNSLFLILWDLNI